LAVIVIVGTVKPTLAVCVRLPLVPNTVTNPLRVLMIPTVIVRVALAVPPGARVTLVGLMVQLLQLGGHAMRGPVDVMRETVPANPLMLVMLMVDVAVVPAGIVRELGFADIVKSGGGVLVKLAASMFSGTITPALTTVTQMLSLLVPVQPVGKSMDVPRVLPTML
jgi:hypothetical protein